MDYKQLSVSDLGLFYDLMKVFAEAFQEPDTYRDNLPSAEYLRDLLAKPHFIVLVAIEEVAVVGGLAAYVLEKFEQDRREIYIYDLAVRKSHRRRGVATGLIDKLAEIARRKRAYVMFVQADKGDEPAIKLYESLGVREDVYHFDIPLEPAKFLP